MDNGCDDPAYSLIGYRRFVSWSARIRREAPLLLRVLRSGPANLVVDLGCGTGEHCRFLAGEGFEVVGVDSSAALIEQARKEHGGDGVSFVVSAIADLPEVAAMQFGGAISLGNTVAHLKDREMLRAALRAVYRVLLPGGPMLFQILNYARLRSQNVRHLPLNFTRDEQGEKAFLRLMEFLPDGRVGFYPTTLLVDGSRRRPVEVLGSQRVDLRGWTREEFDQILPECGFRVESAFGDFQGSEFDAERSDDLLVVARRG